MQIVGFFFTHTEHISVLQGGHVTVNPIAIKYFNEFVSKV